MNRIRIVLEFDKEDDTLTAEQELQAFLNGDFDIEDLMYLGEEIGFKATAELV